MLGFVRVPRQLYMGKQPRLLNSVKVLLLCVPLLV